MEPGDLLSCHRCCQSKSSRLRHERRSPFSGTLVSALTTAGHTMDICVTVLMVLLVISQGSVMECLVINNLAVPQPIINGSTPAIILDCDYRYEDVDLDSLVVKWYYNHSHFPIYQWIPPQKPEALGEFRSRLDLEHRVSEDNYTKHRALRILWPTVELSGNYRCLVSSFKSEDEKNKTLIVYVPADRLEINVTKPSDGSVNVSCISEGGYPEPLISLVMYNGDSEHAEPVDNFRVASSDRDGNGQSNVIGYRLFEDRYFTSKKVVFECVLAIADTDYKEKQRSIHYPGLSSTPRPLSHTNSQVLLTASISTESSRADILLSGGRHCGLASSLLTITTAILSTAITAFIYPSFMFLRYNTFRS